MKIDGAFSLLKDLSFLVAEIADALSSGHPERVEKILPETLRISVAKAAADAKAEAKFGHEQNSLPPRETPPQT